MILNLSKYLKRLLRNVDVLESQDLKLKRLRSPRKWDALVRLSEDTV